MPRKQQQLRLTTFPTRAIAGRDAEDSSISHLVPFISRQFAIPLFARRLDCRYRHLFTSLPEISQSKRMPLLLSKQGHGVDQHPKWKLVMLPRRQMEKWAKSIGT